MISQVNENQSQIGRVLNHFESQSCLKAMRGVLDANGAKSKRFAGRSTSSANITRFFPLRNTAYKH